MYDIDACWDAGMSSQNTNLYFAMCVLLRVHLFSRVCSDAGPGLLLSSEVYSVGERLVTVHVYLRRAVSSRVFYCLHARVLGVLLSTATSGLAIFPSRAERVMVSAWRVSRRVRRGQWPGRSPAALPQYIN